MDFTINNMEYQYMLKFQIVLIAMLIVCVVFTSCERVQKVIKPTLPDEQDMMSDPIMDEILPVYKSWRYAQPLPAPPEVFTEAKDSGSAHGAAERTVYLDGIDHQFFYGVPALIDAGKPVVYPVGLTIVKEIMDDTNTFVWRIAVMQKTNDTMYSNHNNWIYAQYRRDSEAEEFVAEAGDFTEKGSSGCQGCHAQAAHDNVFVTELLLELGRARLDALNSGQSNPVDNGNIPEN